MFIVLCVIECDRDRLWRLQTLSSFIWDVGLDTGDRYNGVDVFLLCREAEFDGSGRDDFGDGERTSPLVIQLLHGVVRGVVLKTQPGFVSDLVLQCCLTVPVIILLHVICCPFEHSLCLLLGTIQSPCEGVHSLHCQCPCRLYSQAWVLTGIELKGDLTCCRMDLVVVCKLC